MKFRQSFKLNRFRIRTIYLLLFLLAIFIFCCDFDMKHVLPHYDHYEIIPTFYQYMIDPFSDESISRKMAMQSVNRFMNILICVFFVYGLNIITTMLAISCRLYTSSIELQMITKLIFSYLYRGPVPAVMNTVLTVALINDLYDLLLVDTKFRPLHEYLQNSFDYLGSAIRNALTTCSNFFTVKYHEFDDSEFDDYDYENEEELNQDIDENEDSNENEEALENVRLPVYDDYVFDEAHLFDYDREYDDKIMFEKAQRDMIERINKLKTI